LKNKIIAQVDTSACGSLLINNILLKYDTTITTVLKDQCNYDSAKITYNVKINPLQLVKSIADISIIDGDQVVLSITATGSVLWSGSGLSCYTCLSPVANPTADTRYIVSTGSGLCTTYDTVNIHILPKDTLYLPTAFSPNGDGRNDVFNAIGYATDFSMKIFNRWGEEIFFSKSVSEGWNGMYKNKPQLPGVYVVMIQYKNRSGLYKLIKGTITLIR
jgi:gliding motility-associated-like protein